MRKRCSAIAPFMASLIEHVGHMRITIDDLDVVDMKRVGFTELSSFPVAFRSSVISGYARFVPAADTPESCIGKVFDVEINQERISDFEVLKSTFTARSVSVCVEANRFAVYGIVSTIHSVSEPAGEQVIYISAGEALFAVTKTEIGGVTLSVGDVVRFVAHDVTLWDEAI